VHQLLLFANSFTSSYITRSSYVLGTSRRNLIQQQTSKRSSNNNNEVDETIAVGIRLNKVFKATHSRREADKLIEFGRVCVNGETVRNNAGMRVIPYRDVISLDGKVVRGWERMNAIIDDKTGAGNNHCVGGAIGGNNDDDLNTSSYEYVKYFKPLGTICTTDSRIRDNIIDAIKRDGYRPKHRVYPVGRLDKETSGLIVLTSDGRMVNAVLRGERKQPKVYKVMVNGRLEDDHLRRLRDGIVIKTVAQRKGRTEEENTLIAKTKPCKVERIGPSSCRMTLTEGRNRQIRKMMEALGFRVVKLHRVEFMGLRLNTSRGGGRGGLERPGDWEYLDDDEMRLVRDALRSAEEGKTMI